MKTKNLLPALCFSAIALCHNPLNAQDLTSINVGTTLPKFTYDASTRNITVQMTIRNIGYFNSDAFDVSLFLINTSNNTQIEIDRTNQSGLSYNQLNNANTLYITDWNVSLKEISQVTSGTYRVEARINDNKNATETNYANNTEKFGNSSFSYAAPGVGLAENKVPTSFQVWPNPSHGIFNLNLANNHHAQSLEIYNMLGEKIYATNLSLLQNTLTIDLSQQAAGNYIVKLIEPQTFSTCKIVLQHNQ